MSEVAPRQRFLIISNGHGEDAIAAGIAERLQESASVEAYPMIGSGKSYDNICRIVGPRATLASEGWRNVKGSVRRDVVNGGLGIIPPALKFIRSAARQYDQIVVVGDMTGVLACLLTGIRGITYLDVYKTGAARLYSGLESWVIAKTCRQVFCRAENLAELLRQAGVRASAPGNLMMDTIPQGEYDAAARRRRDLAVALLPGSRALTAESFALQVSALRQLPADLRPDVFVAVAGSVNVEDLTRAAGLNRLPLLSSEPDDLGALTDGALTINLVRGRAMGNVLATADVVMSQAGTASVQALGLGRPVITFRNARDRQSRFDDEQRLFGDARVIVEAEPSQISAALKQLLGSPAERQRLGAIGQERIGPPGAIDSVLEAVLFRP